MDMLEQKQDFLSEPAGPEWERAWASMQNRTIPDPSSLDLPLDETTWKNLISEIRPRIAVGQ